MKMEYYVPATLNCICGQSNHMKLYPLFLPLLRSTFKIASHFLPRISALVMASCPKLSLTVMSAPFSSSACVQSTRPFETAMCRGVSPCLVCMLGSTPCRSSNCTTSGLSASTASCSSVFPLVVQWSNTSL